VQTGAVAGGFLTKTGFDCYYSLTCGIVTGFKSMTSDGTAITTISTASSPKSHNSKILAIALETCIPMLLLVTILLPYLLLRRRGSNPVHRVVNQPSSTQSDGHPGGPSGDQSDTQPTTNTSQHIYPEILSNTLTPLPTNATFAETQ
jgi:hypothetical protein